RPRSSRSGRCARCDPVQTTPRAWRSLPEEPGRAASAPRRGRQNGAESFALALLIPLLLNVILALLYPAHYDQRRVISQYFHGIYRPRVLGRELVIGIGDVVAARRLPFAELRSNPHGLLPGFIIVNTASFLVAAGLLYRLSARLDRSLTPLYLATVVAIACSAT